MTAAAEGTGGNRGGGGGSAGGGDGPGKPPTGIGG